MFLCVNSISHCCTILPRKIMIWTNLMLSNRWKFFYVIGHWYMCFRNLTPIVAPSCRIVAPQEIWVDGPSTQISRRALVLQLCCFILPPGFIIWTNSSSTAWGFFLTSFGFLAKCFLKEINICTNKFAKFPNQPPFNEGVSHLFNTFNFLWCFVICELILAHWFLRKSQNAKKN